jgi:hypothetical protein
MTWLPGEALTGHQENDPAGGFVSVSRSRSYPYGPYFTPTANNLVSFMLECVYAPVPVTIATPETAGETPEAGK